MPALLHADRIGRETLYELGYKYLADNFHKFGMDNKIKIALSVIQIFNKDGSKSLLPQNHLTLVFNGSEKEQLEIQNRLAILTGNNPQIEIQSKTKTD